MNWGKLIYWWWHHKYNNPGYKIISYRGKYKSLVFTQHAQSNLEQPKPKGKFNLNNWTLIKAWVKNGLYYLHYRVYEPRYELIIGNIYTAQ